MVQHALLGVLQTPGPIGLAFPEISTAVSATNKDQGSLPSQCMLALESLSTVLLFPQRRARTLDLSRSNSTRELEILLTFSRLPPSTRPERQQAAVRSCDALCLLTALRDKLQRGYSYPA